MSKKYHIYEHGKKLAEFNSKECAERYIHGTDRVIWYSQNYVDCINMENAVDAVIDAVFDPLIEQAKQIEDSQL